MLELVTALRAIPDVWVRPDAPLSEYTRFGLGGPAAVLANAFTEEAFAAAWRLCSDAGVAMEVIGGGSNLVVADSGFAGVVLRYRGMRLTLDGANVIAEAGVELQALVDFTIEQGLAGIHTMTGIPGWVGGAVYGNAGAYGRSMHQNVACVRYFENGDIREADNAACGFRYRHSAFKERKERIVLAARLALAYADAAELRKTAEEILSVRNRKYPPEMKCAGSIFKNLIFDELPENVGAQVDPKVVREGKVPAAWFLEQVGAKGTRNGGVQVADYHANLIYNAGGGTAAQVREVVEDLKRRVCSRFGLRIEEEVQYVGFS